MSHFSGVKTTMTDRDCLVEAIKGSGFRVELAAHARGYQGQAMFADVVAVLDGEYDIGFILSSGEFQAQADFSLGDCGGGSKSLNDPLKEITALYAALYAHKQAQQNKMLRNAQVNVTVH